MPATETNIHAGALSDLIASLEAPEILDIDDATIQRSEPRYRLAIPIWVRCMTENGPGPAQARQLRDISANGLGLGSNISFDIGQPVVVELALNGMNWSGGMRVMHCTEMVTGYKIGLHVDDVVLPDTGKAEEACKRRDLPQEVLAVKEQIAKSMRAYRLNESTWGLFGKSVRRKVAEVTKGLPEIEGTETEKCQRSQPRLQYDSGAYLLVPTYYGGKWLPAKVEDISKGGAGISMSPEIFKADIQRELMGDFRLDVSLPVLLGLGEEPDILWIPAEVAYSNRFSNGRVRAGLAFNTPKARKAFVG